uniref:Arginyl aminopeptidase (aminopeptidase B) n=1 Tax=Oncorhynchus tshawytscha TaxID=74940 RepID=A0AAZ3Q8V2_ONCTS
MEQSLKLHSDLAEDLTTSSMQTAEKAKPYIFTQDQAVLNRTFFPCFYTLAIKSTYSASVKVMPVRENTPSFPLGNCSLADVIVREMDNTGEDRPLNKLRVKIKPGQTWLTFTLYFKATNVICIFSPPSGVDPDDTYNDMPYEKGFCFVSYLAHLAGDQSCFDAFLKIAYIDKFKFCSVMAEDALEFFLEYFPDLKKKGVHKIEVKGLEFDSWLNVPGWPLYLPDLSAGQSLMKPAEQLSELWAVEGLDMASIMKTNIQAWKTYFLEKIIEKSPLSRGNIEKQEEQYPHIVKSNNAELRLCWAQIIAKNRHQPGYQHVRSFLSCQGKQMYTLPVYHALWNGSEEARSLLQVNVRNYIKKIIA